jgi:hypothetical protein
MPKKLSRTKQSIFDIAGENFGNLDNVIKVSNDNGISISGNLKINTELDIDNADLGEADIKQRIIDLKESFNNNYDALILTTVDTTLITADSTLITADTR